MRLATSQTRIVADLAENAQEIERHLRAAKKADADLVHFPEGALSGYAKREINRDWTEFDWDGYDKSLNALGTVCRELHLWGVIGGVHRNSAEERPFNCLHIIAPSGDVTTRYDKRYCSHTEISYWYRAGQYPVVIDVKGLKVGFLLCIEIQFPELFSEYERLGVDCVLLSAYADKVMFGIQAQGHAACNNYWISYSVPANASAQQPSILLGPDGRIIQSCERNHSDQFIELIDPSAAKWDGPCKKARPWRRRARSREIY